MSIWRVLLILISSIVTTCCGRSNNLLLGHIETRVGSHEVRVTDCYRMKAPQPVLSGNRYTYEPCRDARIVIEGERLSVNGRDYGHLDPADSVLVDHGVVSTRPRTASAQVNR